MTMLGTMTTADLEAWALAYDDGRYARLDLVPYLANPYRIGEVWEPYEAWQSGWLYEDKALRHD